MSERIVPLFQVNGKEPVQPAFPGGRPGDVPIQYSELEQLLCDELACIAHKFLENF